MANLVITIIGIALLAIAAIMAVWYGGGAYQQGQVKAQANTLLQASNQIAAAWQAYAVDRGGDYSIPAGDYNGINDTLVPTYLSQAVALSGIASGSGLPYPVQFTSGGAFTNVASNSNTFNISNIPQAVCAQVNLITQNNATILTSTTSSNSANNATIYQNNFMGYCFQSSSNGYYYFSRRVFN